MKFDDELKIEIAFMGMNQGSQYMQYTLTGPLGEDVNYANCRCLIGDD